MNTTPILLLKTKSIPNDGYFEQFSSSKDDLQFEPIFVPVLEHQLLDEGIDVVRGLLHRKEISNHEGAKYGGMIFTSQRAVEAFSKLVEEGKGEETWPHLQEIPIYTVGPATSRALRSIPQTPPLNIFGAETGNGEALAHYMLDHYGSWYKEKSTKPPLLFLVGEQRRDIIPKTLQDPALPSDHRTQVDELVIYGTGVMESFPEDFTRVLKSTAEKDTRWVVVFSPTGCEAMLRVLDLLDESTGKVKSGENLRSKTPKTFIITIGPTTRDFLKDSFRFEPDVCAEKPSPEGLRAGIVKFLSDMPS